MYTLRTFHQFQYTNIKINQRKNVEWNRFICCFSCVSAFAYGQTGGTQQHKVIKLRVEILAHYAPAPTLFPHDENMSVAFLGGIFGHSCAVNTIFFSFLLGGARRWVCLFKTSILIEF